MHAEKFSKVYMGRVNKPYYRHDPSVLSRLPCAEIVAVTLREKEDIPCKKTAQQPYAVFFSFSRLESEV